MGFFHRFFSDAIAWSSKLTTSVATCVNHAEYGSLAKRSQRMSWLVMVFQDLYKSLPEGHVFPEIKPVVIYTDNAGAIYGNVRHGSN